MQLRALQFIQPMATLLPVSGLAIKRNLVLHVQTTEAYRTHHLP
jgi:hypothetical protein